MVSKEGKLFGVCKVSVASILAQPDVKATMVSQALFGEFVELVRSKNKNWCRIICCWDREIGWVDPKHFFFSEKINEDEHLNCNAYALELIHGIYSANRTIPISIGSNLPNNDGINLKLPFGKFHYTGQIINLDQTKNSKLLLSKIAAKYLHAPFLNGGRSILGIDGPGLIQQAFKMVGLQLPRRSHLQGEYGEDIGFASQSEIGDLAFFANNQNEIIHSGFIVDHMKIIHVHGTVRIDQFDDQGIYDVENKRYIYKLRTIRRILLD